MLLVQLGRGNPSTPSREDRTLAMFYPRCPLGVKAFLLLEHAALAPSNVDDAP